MLSSPSIGLTLLAFLAVLGPLVFLHELGHYLVGRWCGIRADVFSIGFGREIAGWTDKRGTRWKIGWMPLGGYVQFAGDADASSTPQHATTGVEDGTFAAAKLWKRMLTVAAGPIANFIVAIVILSGFAFAYGRMTTPPIAQTVLAGSPAAAAGIQPGDRIVSVNGRVMETFQDVPLVVMHRPAGEQLDFVIERGGQQIAMRFAPKIEVEHDRFGNRVERAIIGIGNQHVEFSPVSIFEAPVVGVQMAWSITRQMGEVIGQLLTGKRSVKDLGGPIKIAKASGEQASLGFAAFLSFAALISLNLGLMNLLPMPMLDGGHLLFQVIEAIRRRPVSIETQQWAFRMGFFAMIALMVVVTFNDLGSFGLWQKLAGLIG